MHVHDLFSLTGKVALVTGGGTGLGQQMAEALAEAGADVVIASRTLARCHEVAESLKAHGGRPSALALDLADLTAAEGVIDHIIADYGRLDILVSNAAATDVNKPFERLTTERFEAVLRVNLTGVLACGQAVLDPMRRQGGGKIINIASVYGLLGIDASLYGADPETRPMANFAYTASKGALVNLTRDMAVSWAPYGINVNGICPGMFPVEANMKKWPEGTFDRLAERIPLKRMGTSIDLKGAVVYLASAASDYVTGHNLIVDGGWTAW
jgi:NAD(P)-dependent dehydrogenase (short-subunit alcohol dehydrogenase family)